MRRATALALALALASPALVCGGCQDDVSTPFPPGLEPLEDDPVPAVTSGFTEVLVTQTSDTDYIHVYGRGYVLVPPATLWQAAQAPDPMVAICSTDQQQVTVGNEPTYAYSFLVHYIVNNILTVEWDDQWRYGVIDGTAAAPTLGMIKHQKVQGSDFIRLSEGTIQVLATADPGVTELAFVEHLDSVGASTADVLKGIQHNYDALVAVGHGQPIPPCP